MMEIGTKIFLVHKSLNEDEDESREQLRCRVIDREDDESILVDYPINEETEKQQNLLLEGERFTATFLGKDGALYAFDTKIIARVRKNIPMLQLEDPGKEHYRRIQRRDYVRVEAVLDLSIQRLDKEKETIDTLLVDISGGGCQVVLPKGKNLEKGEKCRLQIQLPMQSGQIVHVQTIGVVVRVAEPLLDNDKERASFKFIEISEAERQKIIKYCFERQLILRRTKE